MPLLSASKIMYAALQQAHPALEVLAKQLQAVFLNVALPGELRGLTQPSKHLHTHVSALLLWLTGREGFPYCSLLPQTPAVLVLKLGIQLLHLHHNSNKPPYSAIQVPAACIISERLCKNMLWCSVPTKELKGYTQLP